MNRALILSPEYPPLIEGGLARHVRKLAESLAELGVDVHVLTRGGEESRPRTSPGALRFTASAAGPAARPRRVRRLGRADELRHAGRRVELGDRYEFDLVHGHDWLVAAACDHLARRFASPLVTTIHATEHGRHQGWVDEHPQSYIHGVERWITNRSDRVIACSYYMREQIADIFGVEEDRVTVIPNGIDPDELQPHDGPELERLRSSSRPCTSGSCCWSAGSCTRRAFRSHSRRCPR